MPAFDTFPFDRQLFDGGGVVAAAYLTDRVVFDGFSLSDGTNIVLTDLLDSGPTTDLVGGPVPRGDGGFVTARYFRERTIEAAGIVKQSTAALLDAFLDTVKENLSAREGDLDLTDSNGTVKRFIATCVNFEELFAGRRAYHTTYCPFRARFVCRTPFGLAREYTALSLALSISPTSQSVVNLGSAKARPVVTLIFTAASSVTAVQLANVTTGETLSYTGSVAAGDIIVFDSENMTVTKNGTAVDYSGAFPLLNPGANLLRVTVTGTSFSAYGTYEHKDAYL